MHIFNLKIYIFSLKIDFSPWSSRFFPPGLQLFFPTTELFSLSVFYIELTLLTLSNPLSDSRQRGREPAAISSPSFSRYYISNQYPGFCVMFGFNSNTSL